ncbi:hypothetical protein [Tardiphaga sp.]|jgi:hypothetical protein|uniref:hypothetical protein n=1 Tax=Tardiphaga sp. TaxID=1926292 RepID=UPI0037DA0522
MLPFIPTAVCLLNAHVPLQVPPETLGENDALGDIEGERMHIGYVGRHVGDCLAPAMRSNSLARWLRGRPVQVGDVTLIVLVGGLGTRARFS